MVKRTYYETRIHYRSTTGEDHVLDVFGKIGTKKKAKDYIKQMFGEDVEIIWIKFKPTTLVMTDKEFFRAAHKLTEE